MKTNSKIRYMMNNKFTGTIPTELGAMTSLKYL